MAARKRKLPKNKTPTAKKTLEKAKAIECKRHTKNTRAELLLLISIFFIIIIFFAFSRYMIRTDLQINIINQTSACLSDQTLGTWAEWSGGNIVMETRFEVPDPCYRVSSIKAVKQGNRIEATIALESGGVCVQCFGYKQVEYEIVSPERENAMDIYIDIEGTVQHYVWLPLNM